MAAELIQEVQPKLKRMSVSNLLESLKAFPSISPEHAHGVAYHLYVEGNQAIIAELKSRPPRDLTYLTNFLQDSRFVVQGPDGAPLTVASLCQGLVSRTFPR
jgi:hypothetical protein